MSFQRNQVYFSSSNVSTDNNVKLNIILRSEYVNTWEFLHLLGKELKVMVIRSLKNIFYSAITRMILKISQFSLLTTSTLKLLQWRVF